MEKFYAKLGFKLLSTVEIVDSSVCEEGINIGIIGFPLGLNISEGMNDFSNLQLTPLLQVGNISAILPFSGLPKPNSFVLDIVVNPGSSGSPLFMEDGKVVGIVYATRKDFTTLMEINDKQEIVSTDRYGVYIPSGLGFAIPSSRFPTEWLSK